MRIAIVEDEGATARRLERLLRKIEPLSEIVGCWASVAESKKHLRAGVRPDLVFLDIDLGDGLGFDLAGSLPPSCAVVFTTAHDQYALRSFELNSVDYLLKPVRESELVVALERYRSRQLTAPSEELLAAVRVGLEERSRPRRFLVRRGKRLLAFEAPRIAYFYRDDLVYLVLRQGGGRYATELSLDRILDRLDRRQFMRLDRRFIANVRAIRETIVLAKSRLLVRLEPDPPFEPIVSQQRASEFKAWLDS